ncbi:hypothetical protein BSL78_20844 [Apostichopus japonicus]|uniref:Uncharacterized protein n=1 Tax=Stichopus japonicus TaxID=307972 RepID=A0A2G8K2U9_STIJA|nr:hypothetical protein BSL78_20844 [Apostichopus japonicus]
MAIRLQNPPDLSQPGLQPLTYQMLVCIGLIGDTLEMSVVLPFSEFPSGHCPDQSATEAAAMLYLPESYVSRPCLAALDKSAKGSSSWEADRNAMKIPNNMWKDYTSRPGWVEAACAPVVAVTVLYNYHPVPLDHEVPVILRRKGKKGPLYSTLPPEQPHGGFRKSDIITEPAAELTSDLLHLEVDIGPLSVMAYGSIVNVILAIKENYLGEFQSITTFDGPEYQEIPAKFKEEEKRLNPLGLRHLDVTVSLNIDGIKGHLPVVSAP